MKTLSFVIFWIAAIAITGFAAAHIANYLALKGAFGSCFEGGCGYGAAFVGFPIAWVTLLGITLTGYLWWRAGRRPPS